MTDSNTSIGTAQSASGPADLAAVALQEGHRTAQRRNQRERLFHRLCTVPAMAITALVALVPLALLVVRSLMDQRSGAFTLQYYVDTFTNAFFMRTLGTTVMMAGGVTVISIVMALPLAYLLARHTLLRNFLLPVITIPRMLPFVVIGYAMILLLAPMTGVANKVLMAVGILQEPAFILFDWPGQAFAFGYTGIVVATAVLTGVLMSVDPQLEDAAVSLGANRLRTFFLITVPLSTPGIVAASALIFTSIFTSYSIPIMLNGRVPYMISVVISANLLTLQQQHLAYAQAVIVATLAIGVTALAQHYLLKFGQRKGVTND